MRLLPNETIILETRPSPRVALVWLFTKALPLGLISAVIAFMAWTIINAPQQRGGPSPYPISTGVLVVATVFVVTCLCAYAYNVFLARTFRYYVTSQRFIFAGGILRRITHAVEHRRVTDVQFSQNIVEQTLSLGSVNLSTPGTANPAPNAKNRAMPELRLEGLPDGEVVFETISNCVRVACGPQL
jgi:uncharacterized membrane protein YdbT with pleckstrin-like domain